MPQWTADKPLRVATGFSYVRYLLSFPFPSCCLTLLFQSKRLIFSHLSEQLGPKFMKENGLKHVVFSTADGALEAAPAVRNTSFYYSLN